MPVVGEGSSCRNSNVLKRQPSAADYLLYRDACMPERTVMNGRRTGESSM